LASEGTGAAVGAASPLTGLGTADATGAGEAVGSFAVFGIGKLPAQPVTVKRTINVAMVQLERDTFMWFIVLLLYLT